MRAGKEAQRALKPRGKAPAVRAPSCKWKPSLKGWNRSVALLAAAAATIFDFRF